MRHQPWPNGTQISGGTSEQTVDSLQLAKLEKELRSLGAFLEGFSEALTSNDTGRAEAKRVGINLRRFE